ncbi:MAG TPA: iron-sulfur cluster assembly accessory protein [Candidatus Thermoplasmatota archaeon]|jgi:iron-sulfur cluster assembly protein|nr:iron-sulfur cluster assembly accessory protein [Candidatus Thermoplasmatota archaeon]
MQLQVTETAAKMLKQAADQQGKADHGLKVDVFPGGCAGFMYELSFQKEPVNGDMVVEVNGVKLFIDPANEPILEGIVIDYIDSLMGGGFNIKNPNATSSCGCGKSFA